MVFPIVVHGPWTFDGASATWHGRLRIGYNCLKELIIVLELVRSIADLNWEWAFQVSCLGEVLQYRPALTM